MSTSKKSSKKERKVADFETTSIENFKRDNEVRVWASQLRDIDTNEVDYSGNDLDGFMNYILSKPKSQDIYFHNLKFDGSFIISHLLSNGYHHLEAGEDPTRKSFTTLITDTGQWFTITIYLKVFTKRYVKVTFFDSLKKLPFSAELIAKAFDLPIKKGTINYTKYRPKGYEPTADEWEYVNNDTEIIARALKIQFDAGLNRMTVASDALHDFIKRIGKQRHEMLFPVLDSSVDAFLRSSYRGGWVYLKPEYSEKDIALNTSFDVNSLFPYAMHDFPLPVGYPAEFYGEYEQDEVRPLYVAQVRAIFELREGMLPTIQVKNTFRFSPTEYLKSSDGELVELTLTSVDLELFKKHYDIKYIEYAGGFKFEAMTGLFNIYIDYWYKVKQTSSGARKALAKLMLNSLYGKYGQNPKRARKIPYMSAEGVLKYSVVTEEDADPLFVAMASFITAWARKTTIDGAQANYDRFIYADTDSIHLIGDDPAKDILIDENIIGAWKHEGTARRAKFIRAKTYMKDYEGKIEVKCAGMPDKVKEQVNFDNFRKGSVFGGKLQAKNVAGGTLLKDIDFSININ